eukprot:CAMPEP_0182418298 /NCGR_PEP_ID=MMETSP1167-20130531/2768_1 /TAXON_ID=2988 /ORGANISM="Mallomonas Sp, Strain CCMP3275" /LENGTH=310 /DNA_ID=CAMNT_0024592443 /DNA_START=182 /DNA_END=1114 /DNA_ORIENTATION=-
MLVPKAVRLAQKTFPTGNPNFAVKQAFPSAISAEDADPFLMCDHFGPTISKGKETNPDVFPVGWHPHRGMDILTYLVEGNGRHADSLGNRGEFASPGCQWISVGSGIEHAEGGGVPAGETQLGFQIWVNVPSSRKMEDPRYGTEPPENIPLFTSPGVSARVVAGEMQGLHGPFSTVQSVQIIDYNLEAEATHLHTLSPCHDTCLVYLYRGEGQISGVDVPSYHVAQLEASNLQVRDLSLSAGTEGMAALLFAGKRLNQPIAWHGPFVMTTQEEIQNTISDYRKGTFPVKRVPWDYKRLSAFPPDHPIHST